MGFWRKEFTQDEINFLLERIKEIRLSSDNGRVSFKGGGIYQSWVAILVSAVGFETRTDELRTQVVRAVLSSPELPIDFTERDFRAAAYRALHRFQVEKLRVYRVAFPIWNMPIFLAGTQKIDDVLLNFNPSKNTRTFKRIIQEREAQQAHRHFETVFTQNNLRDLRECSICLAHVRAISPADANERASEALYEILGLVNLAVDIGKYWRGSSRTAGKLPVSDVLIGPHTTAHSKDGALTHDGFWHENWVGGPDRMSRSAEAMQAWEKRFKKLLERTAKSPWRNECKSAASRYFKAFSNPHLEEAFFEGWQLFENISGSRYEK